MPVDSVAVTSAAPICLTVACSTQQNRKDSGAESRDWTGLAWPALVLIFFFALFRPLARFVEALGNGISGGRGLKIGIAQVNLELAAASTVDKSAVFMVTELPYAAEPGMFASSGRDFIEALIQGPDVEAVTVDLKSGDGFLTSRLFLVCALMQRQRRTRGIAFVHGPGVRRDVYLGACALDDLKRALMMKFPEYEAALALAIHEEWWKKAGASAVVFPGPWQTPFSPAIEMTPGLESSARLPAEVAGRIVGSFLMSLQTGLTLALPEAKWVPLPHIQVQERAEWVTASWLHDQLGPALVTDRVRVGERAVATLIKKSGPYFGVVDRDDRLIDIVSKEQLSEQIALSSRAGESDPS